MIVLDCVPGTLDWINARVGVVTASKFDKIITNKTAKLSDTSTKYAWEVIAEQILGFPMDGASSAFMQRGTLLERKAIEYYELQRDIETAPGGLVLRDDRRVGCTPDRFVGTDGLLEIKCPSAAVHVSYLLGGNEIAMQYRAQVQGQIMLAEREWNDTLSYHPDMPAALVRVHRDDVFIHALQTALEQFLAHVDDLKAQLQKEYGLFAGEDLSLLKRVAEGAR